MNDRISASYRRRHGPIEIGLRIEHTLDAGETLVTAISSMQARVAREVDAEIDRLSTPNQARPAPAREAPRQPDPAPAAPAAAPASKYPPPKTGGALFAHLKSREEAGETGLLKRVNAEVKRRGWPYKMSEFSEEQIRATLDFLDAARAAH